MKLCVSGLMPVQEQRRRSPSTSPTFGHDSIQNGVPTPRSPNANRESAPRLQQTKSMTPLVTQVKAPEPLRIDTKNVSQDSIEQSDVCLSPTWSDHGQKQKEREKRRREKEEKEENRKPPPKRLNKKPPAAMDTQKMSGDLRKPRRNSLSSLLPSRSSSREPSLERPKAERRKSGSSFTSFLPSRRSQSQQREEPQSPDWQPIVAPLAPKLPSFRWKSAETKPTSWGENNASDGKLVGFPYEQQRPVQEEKVDPDSEMISHLAQQRTIRPMIRSSTEPDFRPTERQKSLRKEPKSPEIPKPGKRKSSPKETKPSPVSSQAENQPKPTMDRPRSAFKAKKAEQNGTPLAPKRQKSDEVADELIAMLSDKPRPYQHVKSAPKPCTNQDGSSYVHKQRMYQQQRSIAGFEEQQALQMYNDQAALAAMQQDIRDVQAANREMKSREPSPNRNRSASRGPSKRSVSPRPKDTSRSVSPAKRVSSQQPRPSALSPLKQVSSAPDDSDDEQEKKIKRAKEEISSKMLSIQSGKSEKILGFRRRTKEPPPSIRLPDSQEPPKQSKRDRMSAHIPFRHKRDSSMNGVVNGRGSESSEHLKHANGTLNSPDSRLTNGTPTSPGMKVSANSVPPSPNPKAVTQRSDSRQKNSTDSDDSFHSTTDEPEEHKAKQDAASLAAVYSEGIKTPSSEESLNDPPNSPDPKGKKSPELIVRGVSEGVVRKASITRPRSIPNLQTQTKVPNLDFLPQLKHQALTKSPRRLSNQNSVESSPTRIKVPSTPIAPDTSYKSPLATSTTDLSLLPARSPLRPSNFPHPVANRSATSVTTLGSKGLAEGVDAKPIAKLFVICCKCKFWHDLPSKLYEAMALPKELHGRVSGEGKHGGKGDWDANGGEKGVTPKVATARLETAVKCPWCEHSMSTSCCQGWTTVVYMHQRHH